MPATPSVLQPLSVLICDCEPEGYEALRARLNANDFAVTLVESAEQALELIRSRFFDLALVGINLPVMSGLEACWQIRGCSPRTGIFVLAAGGDAEGRVHALDAGADDCVTKPIQVRELVARLKAVLRRLGSGDATRKPRIEAGGLSLDLERRSLWKGGKEVSLSAKEFDLLEVLMKNEGVAVTRDELAIALWGRERGRSRSLRAYIRKLRRKLDGASNGCQHIFTEPWVGYRFCGQPRTSAGEALADRLRYRIPPHGYAKLTTLRIDQVRVALRRNQISFPAPVPTFEHRDRPDLQWRLALLYFVRGWSPESIAVREGITGQRARQILKSWKRRAVEQGYIQYIPPAEVLRATAAMPTHRSSKPPFELPMLPLKTLLPEQIPASLPPSR